MVAAEASMQRQMAWRASRPLEAAELSCFTPAQHLEEAEGSGEPFLRKATQGAMAVFTPAHDMSVADACRAMTIVMMLQQHSTRICRRRNDRAEAAILLAERETG